METIKLGEIYRKMAEAINECIPVEWKKVYFYGEVVEDATEVFFYFNTPTNEREFIYCHYISKEFEVDEQEYKDQLFELHDFCEELQEEFKENNTEVWTNFTFILEDTGKFNIEYNYEDIIESDLDDVQRQVIWEHKYMGTIPEDEDDRAFLEEYLKENKE